MPEDRTVQPLPDPETVADETAREAWARTITAFLAHRADTPAHLGRTLEAAPDFAPAWAAKGLFYMLLGRSELVAVAQEALENARATLDPADPGAAALVEALDAYVAGRPTRAAERLATHLSTNPTDALAVKLDHAIRFVLGDRRGMLAQTDMTVRALCREDPHYGYLLGCHAFALEENGVYTEAERFGRLGLEHAPDDAWGMHAVAHVYDMTARNDAGIDWLASQTGTWANCNNFGAHMWWHLALFHLDRGEIDRVIDLYDSRIRAEHTDDYRDIANGASMLARLEIEGVNVGDRWEELARLSAERVEPGCVVFADLHYILAMTAGGRRREAEWMIERLARDAQRSEHDMHEIAGMAGLPCAMGLVAFGTGNYGRAFEALRLARGRLQCVGGSHAQRDIFSRLMIEAGIRAGRYDEAEEELVERAKRRGAEDGFTARRRAAIARDRILMKEMAAE